MNLPTDKQLRKEMPIARGVLGYFPNAIAEVARVSYHGNAQHNPGQPLHWSREKSADHTDCIVRHLIEAGTLDEDGMRHSAKLAWRALANLQLELEEAEREGAPLPHTTFATPSTPLSAADQAKIDAAKDGDVVAITAREGMPPLNWMMEHLSLAGVPSKIATLIYGGSTYRQSDASLPIYHTPFIYVAGPMRGYPGFNFASFDKARDYLLDWYVVISPADIDRAAGDSVGKAESDLPPQHTFCLRDFFALYFLRTQTWTGGSIYMLKGWEKSTGATAEHAIATWLGLNIFYEGK